MIRALLAGLLAFGVVGCASTVGMSTEGVSGPVAWRVTDMGVVEGPSPRSPSDPGGGSIYTATLVLKETKGIEITFTEVNVALYGGSQGKPRSGRWVLPARGEVRVPLNAYFGCPKIAWHGCEDVGVLAPQWHFTATGTDDRDRPVRVVIDIALPPANTVKTPRIPRPSPEMTNLLAETRTLSDKIKFAYFASVAPPKGTVMKGDLSNAPPAVREFDSERDPRVVFLYGVYHSSKPVDIKVRWFDPTGALFHTFSRFADHSSSKYKWSYYSSVMDTKSMKEKPGVWTAHLLLDGDLVGKYLFRLANHGVRVSLTRRAARILAKQPPSGS